MKCKVNSAACVNRTMPLEWRLARRYSLGQSVESNLCNIFCS